MAVDRSRERMRYRRLVRDLGVMKRYLDRYKQGIDTGIVGGKEFERDAKQLTYCGGFLIIL